MKKIFVSMGSFIFIGILIIQGLATVARNFAPDGTSTFFLIDQTHVKKAVDARLEVEAVVLGNSHGDDIELTLLPYKGYQLSRAWGDFFEINYYLNYFIPRAPNLKVVFIPISYFSFSWDNASAGKLALRRSQMYTIFPTWNLIKGDFEHYVIGKFNRILPIQTIIREDNWKGVFGAILNGKTNTSTIDDVLKENCEYPSPQDLVNIAESRVIETVKITKDIQEKRNLVHEETYAEIEKIIKFLRSNNIRVVFFTPPYYKDYTTSYQRLQPDALLLMKSNLAKLQEEYGIEYYDFSSNPGYFNDHTLFKDSDHLNFCGKRMFTIELIDLMNGFQP